jgi:hypothetical protein
LARVRIEYSSNGLLVTGVLYCPRLNGPGLVELLVDTGAALTMLSPYDQVHLGIDPVEMGLRRYEKSPMTISGKASAFKLPDCMISLPLEGSRGARFDLEAGELLLMERAPEGAGRRGQINRPDGPLQVTKNRIPSLLGRDLLERGGLVLYADFGKRAAYLGTS